MKMMIFFFLKAELNYSSKLYIKCNTTVLLESNFTITISFRFLKCHHDLFLFHIHILAIYKTTFNLVKTFVLVFYSLTQILHFMLRLFACYALIYIFPSRSFYFYYRKVYRVLVVAYFCCQSERSSPEL